MISPCRFMPLAKKTHHATTARAAVADEPCTLARPPAITLAEASNCLPFFFWCVHICINVRDEKKKID